MFFSESRVYEMARKAEGNKSALLPLPAIRIHTSYKSDNMAGLYALNAKRIVPPKYCRLKDNKLDVHNMDTGFLFYKTACNSLGKTIHKTCHSLIGEYKYRNDAVKDFNRC